MQKILIVEDDEKLRHELEIFLQRNGYEAFGLENFERTLEEIPGAYASENEKSSSLPLKYPF